MSEREKETRDGTHRVQRYKQEKQRRKENKMKRQRKRKAKGERERGKEEERRWANLGSLLRRGLSAECLQLQ